MLFKLISILFEGLLTENVYKKGMTELDIKLKEGDLTPQGYLKKKKKLLDEIGGMLENIAQH
jgi:hypothetical protein